MDFARILLGRCAALWRKRSLDEDLDAELRSHIEFAMEENLKRGMSEQAARTKAMRDFGGLTRVKEDYRMQRGLPFLEVLARDVRLGFRQLLKSPGFTLTVILTVALGVGANTAIFTLVHAVMLKSLPVAKPSEIYPPETTTSAAHGTARWMTGVSTPIRCTSISAITLRRLMKWWHSPP